MKRQITAFTATVFLTGLGGTSAFAQNIGNYLSSGGSSTSSNRLSPTAPVPSNTLAPATPLRPPIAPSYSSYSNNVPAPQPIAMSGLPPQADTTTGNSSSYSSTTTYSTGQSSTTSSTTTQGSTSSTNKTHHKGLAEDTVDVGAYIVKAYVWTYIVLPTDIVKGTIRAIF